MKSCWRQLEDFEKVGNMLMKRYENAVRVDYVNKTIQPQEPDTSIVEGRDGNLAFFDLSPNYCQSDSDTGFPGMRGRKCSSDDQSVHKCNRMCTSCGLRFRNDVVTKTEKCKCNFVWCCHIRCQMCNKQVKVTTCL